MKPQWTEQTRVEAMMKATGASANDTRDYLAAEEGSVEDAVISYERDKFCKSVLTMHWPNVRINDR